MSSPTNPPISQKPIRHRSAITFRWNLHRRRRQRLPIARLGGENPRRGSFAASLCKKVKLKWVRVKYLTLLRKLKKYYDSCVKDLMGGSGAIESFQQRMLLETSFAIPVMGLSLNAYPSSSSCALNRPMF
ncbi:hypothetical protein OROGR_028856 [Orobanche gracilis]